MTRHLAKIFLSIALICSVQTTAAWDYLKLLGGAVKAVQAYTITDAQLAEYVKQSVAQMDRTNKVLPESSPYTVRLRKLTKGITSADGIPLNFKVYQTSELNAFACPDGSVRVYTGIMDAMTDDELLGVIGHEIGHVLKHHSKNALKNDLLTGAARDAISSYGGTIGALSDSMLGDIGQALASAKYSRKQESEADDCGYDFLVKNGKNPWAIVMAFEKLQKLEGKSSAASYLAKAFSSHPDTQKRINNLTKRCKADGYTRPAAGK